MRVAQIWRRNVGVVAIGQALRLAPEPMRCEAATLRPRGRRVGRADGAIGESLGRARQSAQGH